MSESENLKMSKRFVCPVCEKSFADGSALQLHCPYLEEGEFLNSDELHESFNDIRNIQDGLKHAGAEFDPKNSISTHGVIESNVYVETFHHHSKRSSQASQVVDLGIGTSSIIEEECSNLETQDGLGHEEVTQRGDKKPHVCSICGKTFKYECLLRSHIKFHGNERPHHCDICGKKFTTKSNLTQHKLRHADEKPYLCNICNKSFKTERDLVKHKIMHSDERPFECDICNASFKRKSDLIKHKFAHGNKGQTTSISVTEDEADTS